ncbi:MAG TPA: hypothetical protein PK544_09565 [Spirochaetota bacterium]|nr:hypothetical protein [Spirochaetota bacterium]
MKLSEIIRNDSDRLFVIDRECFIIFTGSSLNDERPFIRIGNYIDLPSEIIPFIENIVITDLLVGNPAYEQFNIDIKSLPENRYIGSKNVVNKYLNFQKIFGLDLTNAKIVDVETDIPYLSKEKESPDRDAFIGIFYTNGNFKINYRNKNLLDLKKELENTVSDRSVFDTLASRGKAPDNYGGSGVVFVNNDPLFYHRGYFTAYHFPRRYYEDFNTLRINPARIREIIHPSMNFIHVTNFLKWKNSISGRVRFFSGNRQQVDVIQGLFPGLTIVRKDFNGFSHNGNEGLSVKNYTGTFNIKLTYKKTMPESESLSVAYIKSIKGLDAVLKDRIDGLMIPYRLFEESSLLLRGSMIPAAVIYDDNENISKLKDQKYPVLYPGVQYEFMKFTSPESLMKRLLEVLPDYDIPEEASSEQLSQIKHTLSERIKSDDTGELDKLRDAFNVTTAIKVLLDSSTDRKTSGFLKKLLADIETMVDRKTIASLDRSSFRIAIAFCNNSMYEVMYTGEPDTERAHPVFNEIITGDRAIYNTLTSENEKKFYLRTLEDRERLKKLLDLYTPKKDDNDISSLKVAIEERKKEYFAGELHIEESVMNQPPSLPPYKRIAGIAVVLLSLLAAGIIIQGNMQSQQREAAQQQIAREKKVKKQLIQKYNIYVSANDVYQYANEVALQNGYTKINFTGLKEKNPNWIYPGNIFLLDNGKKIIVKDGDTLWDLAHERLIEKNIQFYKIIELMRENSRSMEEIMSLAERARSLAFNERQITSLQEILKLRGAVLPEQKERAVKKIQKAQKKSDTETRGGNGQAGQ